jgi:hydroxyethylthiazole kinase-like uncharacterized protein yjeF
VLCGPGNNGGDGFVAARHLADAGWPVKLALLGSPEKLSAEAAHAASLWNGPLEPLSAECLEGAGIVIDAIFGAGLSRPLDGKALALVETLAGRQMPTCAVDIPSGLDGASGTVLGAAAPAELTVTFFRKKPGHLLYPGRGLCGDVLVADIGIPASVLDEIAPNCWENGPDRWLGGYPWPQPESYKYKRGEVLILGGEVITGASRMTAEAAARAGAGMVTLAAPARVWSIYATSLINAIVRSFDGLRDFEALLADKRRNVIAIGPGAGVGSSTRKFVLAALATRRAAVLDADALTSFAEAPQELFQAIAGPCVLTPHAGEFMRLFPFEGDKLRTARRGGVGAAGWSGLPYLWSIVENGVQKRVVDLDLAVVTDEAELTEFVHEVAHAGSGGADHLRQCFLADLDLDRLQAAFLAEIRQQQQKPCQPLFARIEQLVDQIRLDPAVARQQIRHEKLGESRLVMEGCQHRGLRDGGDNAVFQRGRGGKPEFLAVQAPLAKKLPGLENPDDRFLALLGHHENFDSTFLDVKDCGRRFSL